MIQTIITHGCPKCGSLDLVKNGRDYKGDRKYPCKTGASYGTLNAQRVAAEAVRQQVKRALLERVSLRAIQRLWGVSRPTLALWIEGWVAQLPAVE